MYVKIINSGDELPYVSDTEVAYQVSNYGFIFEKNPNELRTAHQWWNEDAQERRLRDGSAKIYAWLLPFLPPKFSHLERLEGAKYCEPHRVEALAKQLRAMIRECRASKKPYEELLLALYGLSVAADFSASLEFEGVSAYHMAQFVDLNDVRKIKLDFSSMGYQCINSLAKTDIKWLVEAFGEPVEHQSFDSLWPHIRHDAIARYCWKSLRESNSSAKSLGWPQETMRDWLNQLVKRNIGYFKAWQNRVSIRKANAVKPSTKIHSAKFDSAWEATRQTFIVADIETTGLNATVDEIIELAAVCSLPNGQILKEFSILVRPLQPIPPAIVQLTGISMAMIDKNGVSLDDAMKAFSEFIGSHPIFFHNAPFDQAFIKKASNQTKKKFLNPIYDTLPLTKQAWPSLKTYKLAVLAQQIGISSLRHRALSDAKTTLAVLLAARDIIKRNS